MPQASILVTAYNCSNYIKECIDSIKCQSYTNWECLVLDDCSSDNTHQVIVESIGDDSRFRVFVNTERKTALPNLMTLIKEATAPVIVIVDGDDFWTTPNALARIIIEYQDSEVDATYGSYIQHPSGKKGHCALVGNPLWFASWWYGHTLSWKRELSLRSFNEEPEVYINPLTSIVWDITYDVVLYFPVLYRARKVVFIPDVNYAYRRHEENDDITYIGKQKQVGVATWTANYWAKRVLGPNEARRKGFCVS